jgi:hypothetical protein
MTAVPLTFGKLHRGLTQIAGLREFRVSAGFVDEMARVYAHRRSFVRCHYFAFLKRSVVLDIMSFLSYLNGKSARNDL